jgi:hypothetical protein
MDNKYLHNMKLSTDINYKIFIFRWSRNNKLLRLRMEMYYDFNKIISQYNEWSYVYFE